MLQVTQGCSCAGPGSPSPAACPVLASERRCLIQFLTPQKTHREKHTFEIKPSAGPRRASTGCQDLLTILLLVGPRQGEGCWGGAPGRCIGFGGCWSHLPLSLGTSSSCCSSLRSRLSQPLPPLSLSPADRLGTLVADPGDSVNGGPGGVVPVVVGGSPQLVQLHLQLAKPLGTTGSLPPGWMQGLGCTESLTHGVAFGDKMFSRIPLTQLSPRTGALPPGGPC